MVRTPAGRGKYPQQVAAGCWVTGAQRTDHRGAAGSRTGRCFSNRSDVRSADWRSSRTRTMGCRAADGVAFTQAYTQRYFDRPGLAFIPVTGLPPSTLATPGGTTWMRNRSRTSSRPHECSPPLTSSHWPRHRRTTLLRCRPCPSLIPDVEQVSPSEEPTGVTLQRNRGANPVKRTIACTR